MADEYTRPPYNRPLSIPQEYNWQSLTGLRGAEPEGHSTFVLREPGIKLTVMTPG